MAQRALPRDIPTDVLVVGGGGAGLRAAVAAHEAGADVILASKTAIGRDNCTGWAHGGFSGALGGRSVEDCLDDLRQRGAGLNDAALARRLAAEGERALLDLERLGVSLAVRRGGASVSGPPMRHGLGLTEPLLRHAERQAVAFHEPVIVAEVIRSDAGVTGALAVDLGDGSLVAYRCGAVVLATGGFAGAWARSDNPGRTAGDGIALAAEAGAETLHMEFLRCFELGLAHDGLPFDACNFGPALAAGSLRTPDGETIGRDAVDAWLRERSAPVERNDGRYDLLLDLTGVTSEQWDDDPHLNQIRQVLLRDFPVKARPLRVSPLAHYTTGGIRVDEYCCTAVPGLLAAGEVTGGVFGAQRPGGGALTDIIVFGAIAGRQAADIARSRRLEWRPTAAEQAQSRLRGRMADQPSSPTPQQLRDEVGWALHNHCFVYRHEAGLKRCLEWLAEVSKQLPAARAATPDELCVLLEAEAACAVGQRAAAAALERRESVGDHSRLDFPPAA